MESSRPKPCQNRRTDGLSSRRNSPVVQAAAMRMSPARAAALRAAAPRGMCGWPRVEMSRESASHGTVTMRLYYAGLRPISIAKSSCENARSRLHRTTCYVVTHYVSTVLYGRAWETLCLYVAQCYIRVHREWGAWVAAGSVIPAPRWSIIGASARGRHLNKEGNTNHATHEHGA